MSCTQTAEPQFIAPPSSSATQISSTTTQITLPSSFTTPTPQATVTAEPTQTLTTKATNILVSSPTSQLSSTPLQRGTQSSQIAQIEFPTRTPFPTATVILSPYDPPAPLPTPMPYPTSQPTKTPKPTATINASSFAQRTGQPEIDLIIEVIEARDKEALRTLISFTTFKCTNVGGIGGPPKCWGVGGKRFDPPLPEGTELELLPIGAPVGWPLPETIDSILDKILGYPALEAVYKTETDSYLSSEEGWPVSDTAIILSHGESQIALLVKDGRIVVIDFPDPFDNWLHEIGDYLLPPQS